MAITCIKPVTFSDGLTELVTSGRFQLRPLNGREHRREAARQQQREAKKQRKEVE